jgi:aerobic carbon-monoxide dehydrogenase medium subunit
MRDFDFLQPGTVSEASRMLAALGDECRVMAGGTALMLVMRQRMLNPSHIISVQDIPDLKGISWDDTAGLRIGALSRHADIAQSELVNRHHPMLAQMAAQVANPQVRNQGTIGGNLCYGDPSTDPPGALMALGAQVILGSARGERMLSMEDFALDYFTTAIAPDELVVAVRVPPAADHTRARYTRFKRTAAEHRPLASVSAVAQIREGLCTQARLVVGASVPVPRRIHEAERFLEGRRLDADTIERAARVVAEGIDPISDLRGSADYRREMVRISTKRTLESLTEQAHAEEGS